MRGDSAARRQRTVPEKFARGVLEAVPRGHSERYAGADTAHDDRSKIEAELARRVPPTTAAEEAEWRVAVSQRQVIETPDAEHDAVHGPGGSRRAV